MLRWVTWWHSADLGAPEAASDVEVRLDVDFDAPDEREGFDRGGGRVEGGGR